MFGCIANKDIWLLREMHFHIQQDFTSEKIVGRIAHKDIWLLHEMRFRVQQDFPYEKIVFDLFM